MFTQTTSARSSVTNVVSAKRRGSSRNLKVKVMCSYYNDHPEEKKTVFQLNPVYHVTSVQLEQSIETAFAKSKWMTEETRRIYESYGIDQEKVQQYFSKVQCLERSLSKHIVLVKPTPLNRIGMFEFGRDGHLLNPEYDD